MSLIGTTELPSEVAQEKLKTLSHQEGETVSKYETQRQKMVEQQVQARGICDERVLRALGRIPREAFLHDDMREFAYEDTPLPIEEKQTISQPLIVAMMTEAAEIGSGDKVLEIGTGSGYAAAVLGEVADEVFTIERHGSLVRKAEKVLREQGYQNVHVRHGDGTEGWPEEAPFDAILVTAGGPEVPPALADQLADGGRLIIPVGPAERVQQLTRLRREGDSFTEEDLGAVRFVPLVADDDVDTHAPASAESGGNGDTVPAMIAAAAEPFESIGNADLAELRDRIGDAKVILLGEASHGTDEFYRMRQEITRMLIREAGYRIVAVEADWPDAARIDNYIRHRHANAADWVAFSRFPQWMWRNTAVRDFVDWLHDHNAARPEFEDQAAFYGLDMYSMSASIAAVVDYLDENDPDAARIARERYSCLLPWQNDPASYGRAALTDRYEACRDEVVAMLQHMLEKRLEDTARDGIELLDARENARLVADAERYYRAMYLAPNDSWNLRDSHMFETLKSLIASPHAPGEKVVVWAHNSHVGDARATSMSARGEHNLGQLCRQQWGDDVYIIGFGTHCGTVAAAGDWDGPMERMEIRASHKDSYERLCHDSGVSQFLLPLREENSDVREALAEPRLERAIGVIYRPQTELISHYMDAILPQQFDEYIWFDETNAVDPLESMDVGTVPETYPFGE